MSSLSEARRAAGARPLMSVSGRALPRWSWAAALVAAAAIGAVVGLVGGLGTAATVVIGVLVFVVGFPLVSRLVEGSRRATDRLVTVGVVGAFALAMVPLVSVVWTVVRDGVARLDGHFFTFSMRGVVGAGGGAYHAIIGTLLMTGVATLISVPVGVLTGIYLVDYGRGPLARSVTFLVDVMTGIPSIVAGLFVLAVFTLVLGPGTKIGLMGSFALSVLMIPIVVRSAEEMFRLVPNELREASLALGVPKWLTVLKVVLPTSAAGLATGVTLAVARVIGETAPLLVTVGFATSTNDNLLNGQMTALSTFAYFSYVTPGFPPEPSIDRAWTAALLLIVIVMVLNLAARGISRFFAPKTR